jgi:hypothetical protein
MAGDRNLAYRSTFFTAETKHAEEAPQRRDIIDPNDSQDQGRLFAAAS